MKTTLNDVRKANRMWFSDGAQRMSNDVEYRVDHDDEGKPWLVRSTYAWTDMFGKKPRLHCRINPLSDELQIQPLVENEFADFDEAHEWLQE